VSKEKTRLQDDQQWPNHRIAVPRPFQCKPIDVKLETLPDHRCTLLAHKVLGNDKNTHSLAMQFPVMISKG